MIHKVLIYGFPFYLVIIEILLRLVLNDDWGSFIGPTLGSVGIGFTMPLTNLKELQVDEPIAEQLRKYNAHAYSTRERDFVSFVWVIMFVFLIAWSFSLYISIKMLNQDLTALIRSIFLGTAIYIVAIILTEYKEKI